KGPDDITLGFNSATSNYEIRHTQTQELLASKKANGNLTDVKITGRVQPDTLRIDPSYLTSPSPNGVTLPVSFDGRDGTLDTIAAQGDANMTLTTSLLTITPAGSGLPVTKVTLTRIEVGILTGGASANTLDASGFASPLGTGFGGVTLKGGGGNDRLLGG